MKSRFRSVRAYLKATDTTQEQLAKALGVSQPHLSQILNGQKRPSVALAVRIEELTGVTVRDLVRGAA